MNKKITYVGLLLTIFVVFIFLIKISTPFTKSPPSPLSISTSLSTTSSSTENKTSEIEINFVAGAKDYSLSVPAGSTIYDAMNILASTTDFSFSATLYPGLGYFINEINGVKNSDGNYWTLYVNGNYSNVGASDYKLSKGDSVEWKYEK
jgi:hypothetical protein